MNIFGKRIKLARELQKPKMSQDDLGSKINRSRSLIAQYESGTTTPPPEKIGEISAITGVSLDFLYGLTDDPRIPIKSPPSQEIIPWLESISKSIFELKELLTKQSARIHTHDTHTYPSKISSLPLPVQSYHVSMLPLPIGAGRVSISSLSLSDCTGYLTRELPEQADFAAVVKGDSMSPTITDGALLFIRHCQTAEIQDNDIVICYLHDVEEWTVRRVFFHRQEDGTHCGLKSDNTEETTWYHPDALDCQGKVIAWENDRKKIKEILDGIIIKEGD